MTEPLKVPLDLCDYKKYEIPQEYMAFIISFKNIDPDQCEDLEYDYLSTGYKLFNSNLEYGNEGKYNFTIIIAKSSMIF